MAFNRYGGKRKSNRSATSVRLTGLFRSKTKRGLSVGSITELDEIVGLLKKARADEKGLVLFLWKNTPDEDSDKQQPDYTLYMDVQNEMPSKRRSIQDDDDEDEEEDEPAPKKAPKKKRPVEDDEESDDEVPF